MLAYKLDQKQNLTDFPYTKTILVSYINFNFNIKHKVPNLLKVSCMCSLCVYVVEALL